MDKFTQAYLECALWSSTGDGGGPLDDFYGIEDFSAEAIDQAVTDCTDFQEANADTLSEAYSLYSISGHTPEEQAGHDFWLTRNRHGAGFWDRGIGEAGTKLTNVAHAYGSCDVYVSIYGSLYFT